jgi:hypothetical protein
VIDTYLESPDDFCTDTEGSCPRVPGSTYVAQPRSVVLLIAGNTR